MGKIILLGLLFFIIFTGGCTASVDHSAQGDSLMEAVPYPDSTEILDKLDIDEGRLYFYKDETGFRHSIVSNDSNITLNSETVELAPKAGVNWTLNDAAELNIIILAGVISNEKVQEISLKQNGIEHFGMIVETKKGVTVWYTIFDRAYDHRTISNELFKLQGLSDNGEVLWEDEVSIKNAHK